MVFISDMILNHRQSFNLIELIKSTFISLINATTDYNFKIFISKPGYYEKLIFEFEGKDFKYGKVGFAYSGAQSKFRPKIAQANLIDLGAEHEPATIYSRDATRQEPTNMILNAPALLTKAANENKVIDQVKSVGWQFGAAPKVGAQIISAIVKWPASRYKFTWAQSDKRWLISYKDTPDVDASGLQLGASTVLIQLVSITASEYHDKVGGITPFSNTVGTGVGYLLRDGKSIKVNWQRDSAEGGTKFTTETGETANFAPGQIWIALTDQAPKFEVPSPVESAPSKSK